ncbi:hypothetical protein AcW1_008428 [Taiwanofungus camphoratus]|nr:hypothetical protein AcW1_008428 [Antrodia cinnamomea]
MTCRLSLARPRTSSTPELPQVQWQTGRDAQLPTQVKVLEIGRAAWWPSADDPHPNKRTVAGEIHVPGDLVPHCQIMHFVLEYAVVFNVLQAMGFSPMGTHKGPLLSEIVEIATAHARGPRPRTYVPLEYRDDIPRPQPLGR